MDHGPAGLGPTCGVNIAFEKPFAQLFDGPHQCMPEYCIVHLTRPSMLVHVMMGNAIGWNLRVTPEYCVRLVCL